MYNCGLTVYDYAHIGNLRAYIFSDTLRRVFEYNKYEVKQIVNITDFGHLTSDADEGEDKMTKALKRLNKPFTLEAMREVANFYYEKFLDDLKSLNVEMPEKFPFASDHISEDIEIVRRLMDKGYGYKTSDGLYFNVSKFPSYGELGNISIENKDDRSRIGVNPEKINRVDFCLWKFNKKLGWESLWGKGFPGWHVECSAMSRKYLGQPFDIHTGGVDHVSVHHNNEIAQSEAAYGKPLADYWMHNEHLILEIGKMSKSTGNYITLQTLKEEAISPLSYRYWLLTAHYRSPVNFTYEAVKAAQNAFIRLMEAIGGYPDGGKLIPAYKERFLALINDDLDMPKAMALMWELIKDEAHSPEDKRATILDFDRVFGLNLKAAPKVANELSREGIPAEVIALAEAREEARKKKDWVKSDALRAEIESRGFKVEDGEKGFKLRG